MSLSELGWSPALAVAFQPFAASGLHPGRVVVEHRGALVLHSESEEIWADVPGRLRHRAASGADLPAVGDWVAFGRHAQGERATIEAVLPRRTAFVRKAAGFESVEQVVAANVDVVFVVTSLVDDLNPRRLERYLALAWESGAEPVVVLTKSDLCESIEAAVAQLGGVTFGVPAHIVSAVTGEGIDELTAHLAGGRTATLVGSSGVGKSTLVNRLCGSERLATAGLRPDGRGRHTTTRRELVVLAAGGCLIDTPGMRELTLWDAEEGLDQAFDDVEALAAAVPVLGLRAPHRAGLRRAGGGRGRHARRRPARELPPPAARAALPRDPARRPCPLGRAQALAGAQPRAAPAQQGLARDESGIRAGPPPTPARSRAPAPGRPGGRAGAIGSAS